SESWEEELERMDQEIEKLQEEFDSREVLYTDEMRDEQLARIERIRQAREQFLQEKLGPDGEYFQRQKEILEPVQRQVFNAVQQVASREGYDFVIDRAQDTRFLYADPEWDVTELVLEELGLLEEASR
ncbi:MAG: OmpH family outer membrane protein, partial [Balneolaceae bacterium]